MRRIDPELYPESLRETVWQVNIARARSSEVLELLKEITLSGSHDRLGQLMDQQGDMCMIFCLMSDELTERTDELFIRLENEDE